MAQGFLQKLFGGRGLRKYKILHPLATGSMSTVYSAVAPSQAVVALKISSPRAKKTIDRINRDFRSGKTEGQIAMELRHPNIVRTYDCGSTSDGEWIAMEVLKGALMQDRIIEMARGMREWQFKPFFAAGAGLQHMHDKGYVHRDFSPKNIFILENGNVKIFDFGLSVEEEVARRKHGNRTGSPSYMAPELIRRSYTDHRVDIYAFGIVLYECLTGRKPAEGRGSLEKMLSLLNVEVSPPSQIRDDVDPKLDKIIMRAVAKDPNDRFSTVEELMNALEAAGGLGRQEATPPQEMMP